MDIETQLFDVEAGLQRVEQRQEAIAIQLQKLLADVEYLAVAVATIQDPVPYDICAEEIAQRAAAIIDVRAQESQPAREGVQHAKG